MVGRNFEGRIISLSEMEFFLFVLSLIHQRVKNGQMRWNGCQTVKSGRRRDGKAAREVIQRYGEEQFEGIIICNGAICNLFVIMGAIYLLIPKQEFPTYNVENSACEK